MSKVQRKFFLILLLLFAAVLLFSAANAETTEENLLYNGDFEILDESGLPEGWFTDAYRIEPGYSIYKVTEGMNGDGSAASIQNTAMNDALCPDGQR